MSQIKKIHLGSFLRKGIITLTLVFATTIVSFAQPCPDPTNPDCGDGDGGPGGPGVPLDGGVALLIAGGIGYVAVKMRKQQLKKNAEAQSVEF